MPPSHAQMRQLHELLSRLDRIATVDRGHRAGLHLHDHKLRDQYFAVLNEWKLQPPEAHPAYAARSVGSNELRFVLTSGESGVRRTPSLNKEPALVAGVPHAFGDLVPRRIRDNGTRSVYLIRK